LSSLFSCSKNLNLSSTGEKEIWLETLATHLSQATKGGRMD